MSHKTSYKIKHKPAFNPRTRLYTSGLNIPNSQAYPLKPLKFYLNEQQQAINAKNILRDESEILQQTQTQINSQQLTGWAGYKKTPGIKQTIVEQHQPIGPLNRVKKTSVSAYKFDDVRPKIMPKVDQIVIIDDGQLRNQMIELIQQRRHDQHLQKALEKGRRTKSEPKKSQAQYSTKYIIFQNNQEGTISNQQIKQKPKNSVFLLPEKQIKQTKQSLSPAKLFSPIARSSPIRKYIISNRRTQPYTININRITNQMNKIGKVNSQAPIKNFQTQLKNIQPYRKGVKDLVHKMIKEKQRQSKKLRESNQTQGSWKQIKSKNSLLMRVYNCQHSQAYMPKQDSSSTKKIFRHRSKKAIMKCTSIALRDS